MLTHPYKNKDLIANQCSNANQQRLLSNQCTSRTRLSDSLSILATSRVLMLTKNIEQKLYNDPYDRDYSRSSSPRNFTHESKCTNPIGDTYFSKERVSPKLKICRNLLESHDYKIQRLSSNMNKVPSESEISEVESNNEEISEFKGYSFHNVKKYSTRQYNPNFASHNTVENLNSNKKEDRVC
jgi:hypothetical protein